MKQCGRTVWHRVVEKSGRAWWNSGTVCHNVAQCGGTVWNNMVDKWNGVVEQWNSMVEQ